MSEIFTGQQRLFPRTCSEIVEGNHSCCEFAVEIIMRLVDSSETGIRIIVGVHAEAEGIIVPQWRRLPMRGVVAEAVHLLGQTLLFHPCLLVAFPLLLPLTLML